jgi:O-methyltransferase involved in polyketide biosynthesis
VSNAEQPPPGIDVSRPHSARIYDYLLDGKDNFAADRAVAEQALGAWPAIRVAARENRAFVGRAVRYLAADAGIDQFLDIGSGLPTASNVHEVAQRINPAARVVYADNDPIVLAHARALLTSTRAGRCAYIQADLREPGKILTDPATRETLDFSRPVALFIVALLHFIPDREEPRRLIKTLVDALPPGSYVVATHGSSEYHTPETREHVERAYSRGGVSTADRHAAEFAEVVFDGLDLVPPGIVPTSEWRPDVNGHLPAASEVAANAGVGRKP